MKAPVTASAEADLQAAVDYRDRRPGLSGTPVLADFDHALAAIGANPRMYSLVDDEYPGVEVREYHLDRFRLRMLYYFDGERPVVFALVHTSRRAGVWHARLNTPS